jgi:Alpha/beta hydrolase domain
MATSGLTAVDVDAVDDLGVFGDGPYERVRGTVRGLVARHDDVLGLDRLPSPYEYRAEFEVLRAVDRARHGAVVVDAENRGGASVLGVLAGVQSRGTSPSASTYPPGMGAGCLFDTGVAYARVQWQTGVCASVPGDAQGVGLTIVRDFGRLLADDFPTRVLAGASQSAWFVNTLVAEGFNVDPVTGRGVYDRTFSHLSAGNWLALNRLADDGAPQYPYVRPERSPLTAGEILTRPDSDPFYVDVTSYTDYYRLRGSVFASAPLPERARHYDVPAPHAPSDPAWISLVFESLGCNGGVEVPLNPVQSTPYVRALLAGTVGDPHELPPSCWFELGPAPPPSPHFHGLAGVELRVPRVDDDAHPLGGIRIPDAELPLGRPEPVALSPCSMRSIDDGCGNFGGWQPYDAAHLAARYGSADEYAARYAAIVDGLVAAGFVLPRDRDTLVRAAHRAFGAAT